MGSTFIYIRLMPTVWLRYFCVYIVCHLLYRFRSMVPLQLHQWRLRDALLKWSNWVWMMYVVLLWWLLKDNEMQCCRIHVANIVTLIIYRWHAGLCCVSWILSHHLYHEIRSPNLLVRGWEISTFLEKSFCSHYSSVSKEETVTSKEETQRKSIKTQSRKRLKNTVLKDYLLSLYSWGHQAITRHTTEYAANFTREISQLALSGLVSTTVFTCCWC